MANFRCQERFAAGGKAVVASAGIPIGSGGPADFLDQRKIEKALERGVRGPGPHANFAAGKLVGLRMMA